MKSHKPTQYRLLKKTLQKEWWNTIAQNQRDAKTTAITSLLSSEKMLNQADLRYKMLRREKVIRAPEHY